MIVDSSALLAILRAEPEADVCSSALAESDSNKISAGNYMEAALAIDAGGDAIARRRFDELIARAGIEIVPFSEAQAVIGRAAYRDFGEESGHPARLNFGDCFAYALAKATGEPLLFVGQDFLHTDVISALRT